MNAWREHKVCTNVFRLRPEIKYPLRDELMVVSECDFLKLYICYGTLVALLS